jgi:Mn2+/Fe2+ NRAMP family transporter
MDPNVFARSRGARPGKIEMEGSEVEPVSASSVVERSKPRILRVLGPGIDHRRLRRRPKRHCDDTQAGAQFGCGVVWTLLFSYPLPVAIQIISARIGRTTGAGIARNPSKFHPNWIVYSGISLLLAANTINLEADIGAMAEAVRLLLGWRRTGKSCASSQSNCL